MDPAPPPQHDRPLPLALRLALGGLLALLLVASFVWPMFVVDRGDERALFRREVQGPLDEALTALEAHQPPPRAIRLLTPWTADELPQALGKGLSDALVDLLEARYPGVPLQSPFSPHPWDVLGEGRSGEPRGELVVAPEVGRRPRGVEVVVHLLRRADKPVERQVRITVDDLHPRNLEGASEPLPGAPPWLIRRR